MKQDYALDNPVLDEKNAALPTECFPNVSDLCREFNGRARACAIKINVIMYC